jgi:hypothetical protein
MFSEKYEYSHPSSPELIEDLENLSPENFLSNDTFSNDNYNNNINYNQENDNNDTDLYYITNLKDKNNPPFNNSSESNKNASTNALTKTKKEGAIFDITKTPKNTNNANNASNNINNSYLGKKRRKKTPKNYKNGNHTKFCYDNMVRKVKQRLIYSILKFSSSSIKAIKVKKNLFSKKVFISKPCFMKIEQEIIKNINKDYNLYLLNSKLKDIFSNKISKKCKQFAPDHNKKLIEKIYNENIQIKTISILEKTLFECLEHFRGSKYYPELEGLEQQYECVIKDMESAGESNEYIDLFKDFLSRYEEYYNNIKSKPQNKQNKKIKK